MNIVVIGMGYPSTSLRAGVGIPCAALLADVPGFRVTGVQRRSERSGWRRAPFASPTISPCAGRRT